TSILGAAGDDWTKVRMLCSVYHIDYDYLKTYRKELYTIALSTGFFDCIYKFIEHIKHQSKSVYIGNELSQFYIELKKHVESFGDFKNFIEKFNSLNKSFTEKIK